MEDRPKKETKKKGSKTASEKATRVPNHHHHHHQERSLKLHYQWTNTQIEDLSIFARWEQ